MKNPWLLVVTPFKSVATRKQQFKNVPFCGTCDDGQEGANLATYQRFERAHRDMGLAP